MSPQANAVRLYDLAPSPNAIMVRMAAGYLGIPLERVNVPLDSNRSEILAAVGQPLSPAIEHGDTKLFGSAAILRYFDANFGGPSIFARDREGMHAIEGWEDRARNAIGASLTPIFRSFFGQGDVAQASREGSKVLHESTADIEELLAKNECLLGPKPTAADFTASARVYYGMVPESDAPAGSLQACFREHLHLGDGRDRTRAWVERMKAYDA